ncbi:MAG: EcsC family protein [Hyphomicrobiales bacterium]
MQLLAGEILPNSLSEADLAALRRAVAALERPSLAMRMAALVGKPVEFLGRLAPVAVGEVARQAMEAALTTSLRVALNPKLPAGRDKTGHWHKALAAMSGGIGGAFGLGALAIELPITTTILLHAVADIARREGEDLSRPEGGLACIEVFAFAGSDKDAHGGAGYLAVRTALARTMTEAARYIAERGLAVEGAPVLVRVVAQITSRFGLIVSQKFVAQAVPVVGAVAGAAINTAFMEHFQSMAMGHFIVRRLERVYGPDLIATAYNEIKLSDAALAR